MHRIIQLLDLPTLGHNSGFRQGVHTELLLHSLQACFDFLCLYQVMTLTMALPLLFQSHCFSGLAGPWQHLSHLENKHFSALHYCYYSLQRVPREPQHWKMDAGTMPDNAEEDDARENKTIYCLLLFPPKFEIKYPLVWSQEQQCHWGWSVMPQNFITVITSGTSLPFEKEERLQEAIHQNSCSVTAERYAEKRNTLHRSSWGWIPGGKGWVCVHRLCLEHCRERLLPATWPMVLQAQHFHLHVQLLQMGFQRVFRETESPMAFSSLPKKLA